LLHVKKTDEKSRDTFTLNAGGFGILISQRIRSHLQSGGKQGIKDQVSCFGEKARTEKSRYTVPLDPRIFKKM
jgi:hypothetical protein